MRRIVTALLALCFAVSCAKKLEGPAPSPLAAVPNAVCAVQLTSPVELSGSGFSPLMTGALASSKLELPQVSLHRAQGLVGQPVDGPTVTLGDDPAATQVRWVSQEKMILQVSPELALEPGLYDIGVTNANAHAGTATGALLAVAAPSVSSATPALVCGDKSNRVVLAGTSFIKGASSNPTVRVGAQSFAPADLTACTPLPGESGLQSCTGLAFDLADGVLAPGTYPLSVKNPSPVDCVSGESFSLTVVPEPVITQVAPTAICSEAPETQVVITGTGFLQLTGGAAPELPRVLLGSQPYPPTPSGCSALDANHPAIEVCTTLTLSVPTAALPVGAYPVSVTNPAPADCAATGTFTLEITAPPTLTSVAPAAVCAGGATLALQGTNFAAGMTVQVRMGAGEVSAVEVQVQGSTTATARLPGGFSPGGPYTVSVSNGDGCSAERVDAITVVPGPQIFFVDPPVAYNGITLQATVYGTGFTGTVQAVRMRQGTSAALDLAFTYDPTRPNQVQVTVPLGTTPGAYSMELEDSTACATQLADALQVTDQTTLVLGTPPVAPAFGWTGQTTPVSVFANTTASSGFLAVPRLYLNPAVPDATTVATQIGSVSFNGASQLTALIRAGLPAGLYDVIAVNPDGQVGVALGAFRITTAAPPTISGLSPGSISNQGTQAFKITGQDFRQAEVSFRCIRTDGTPAVTGTPSVTNATGTELSVSFVPGNEAAACVVRVTDKDNETFADYSALVITNPSQNLSAPKPGQDLLIARRGITTLAGDADTAARFLHVIGGDSGDGIALGTVESASLGLLGDMQPFFEQRNRLKQPRTQAAGATIGRWLYVAGGSDDATRRDTVERAFVLDPKDRGEVVDLLLAIDDDRAGLTGLTPGLWYYRVASVMKSSDPFNPDGENLASDPFPVRLPNLGNTKFDVTVTWKADPGAAKYRIYRSPTPGATIGTERVIAEVPAGTTSYKDIGAPPLSSITTTPLPVGSLGEWQLLSAVLSVPRAGPAVAWAMDPADATRAYLYVLGGKGTGNTVHNSFELLPIDLLASGAQTPASTFTAGTALLGTARWQLSAATATSQLSKAIPANQTRLYVLTGTAANGTTVVGAPEMTTVLAGGQLAPFAPQGNRSVAGSAAVVAGDFVFAFGGENAGPGTKISDGGICASAAGACSSVGAIDNWTASNNMSVARYQSSGALSGAFIYITGGVSAAGTPPTVTRTTEYFLW